MCFSQFSSVDHPIFQRLLRHSRHNLDKCDLECFLVVFMAEVYNLFII